METLESDLTSSDQHGSFPLPVSIDSKCHPTSIDQICSTTLPRTGDKESYLGSADPSCTSPFPVHVDPESQSPATDQHCSVAAPVSVDNKSNPVSFSYPNSSYLLADAHNESHPACIDQDCSSSFTVNINNESKPSSVNHSCSSSVPVNSDVEICPQAHQESSSLPINVENDIQQDSSTSLSCLLVAKTTSSSSSLTGNIKKELASESAVLESRIQNNVKVEKENGYEDMADSDSYEEMASPQAATKEQESPCKILTKYIFINKPAKVKTGKKRLGLLYKQAFRHFQRSKVNSRHHSGKEPSVIEKKRAKRQTWDEGGKIILKRGKKKCDDGKSEKRSTGVKGSDRKAKGRKSKLNVVIKKDTTTSNRKSLRKAGKDKSEGVKYDEEVTQSSRRRTKSKKRKTISLSEKVAIIKQLESHSGSFTSVAKSFNVSKSTLTRIMKEKDKILSQNDSKVGEKKSKTRKGGKKEMAGSSSSSNSIFPVIKIERCDDGVYENDFGFGGLDSTNDIKDFPLASSSHLPSGGRSRRELTLQEKAEMLRELESTGMKVKHIAQKYGVSTSAVSRIRKHRDRILTRSLSGDVCQQMKRSRECKDPLLDKALLKWYRAIEGVTDQPISITNTLLQDKVRDIAIAMGKTYFPSVNWIIRWKYRHNIKCKSGRIETKEKLDELDLKVNMTDIITAVEGQMLHPDMFPEGTEITENGFKFPKPEKYIVCEHCGILTSCHKDKRKNNHLENCPMSFKLQRRDLTLREKAQVVRALERPGTKMVFLAKKYGVSSSAISRIHKNRVDILARCAGAYVNVRRKRDRVGKEPEVERILCDWYRQQLEYGYHVSGATIREKAHEIAALMGKEFWPSDSWVFRWRHRNNVNAIGTSEEVDEIEEEMVEDPIEEEVETAAGKDEKNPSFEEGDNQQKKGKKTKRKKLVEGECEEEKLKPKFPRSVMCEKCGCVSARLKNNRIRNMRHAKGCPDLKPRHELTYEERVKLLKALEEPGATLSSVARRYGVSASSMSRMNQKKASILDRGTDFACHKRIRDCKEPEVAKLLYSWFMEKQREGVHVTGTKLKEKAAALAKEMGREFKASTGWLGRWKHRYNVIFRPKEEEKAGRDVVSKRKSFKKKGSSPLKEEVSAEAVENNHQNEGNAGSIITILPDESQPSQAPRMFLAQRYQNPWAVNHQPPSCTRPKDFVQGPNHGVPAESHVPYPYDHVPRHMFHNMFENFATAAGYPVPMVEPSVPVRDYVQPEEPDGQQASSSLHHHHHHHHHHPVIPHQPPPLNLQSMGLTQHQTIQPPQPTLHQASQSPVNSVNEEEGIQQQQIMEACKLMNSFAKEKSLGEHVQAALRTIEMTLKSGERKGPPRATYTHI